MALRTFVLAIAIPLGCLAQSITLGLSSGVATPGTSVDLALTLNATAATPVSIQWALEYNASDFSAVTVTAGPAATESGKTITCNQASGLTTCILWSMDDAAIGNGVVAAVTLTAAESTVANSSGVQLVNCLAANAEGYALSVSGQGGGVTLQQLITANPNPIPVAPGATTGQATISWNAPDSSSVEVHIGSATGTLFAEGGSSGSSQTGDWVQNGTVFVLVDATTHAVLEAAAVTLAAPTIAATPNPILVPAGAPAGQTTITWNAPGYSSVEVHVGSAEGTLFAEGGPRGSSQTGDWVENGMVFVLVDAATHAVLATTTVTLGASTIAASPNPILVTAGAPVGQTTITWNAPGQSSVEVHVGSAAGTLFAAGGPTGSSQTGDWVTKGMVFVLVDATTQTVLATTTVTQAQP